MLSKTQVMEMQSSLASVQESLPYVFSALSDVGRYRIFELLIEHKNLCVTDIARVFGVSVPAASQQLKVLELSGLVTRERHGQMICYSVRTDTSMVRAVVRIMVKSGDEGRKF